MLVFKLVLRPRGLAQAIRVGVFMSSGPGGRCDSTRSERARSGVDPRHPAQHQAERGAVHVAGKIHVGEQNVDRQPTTQAAQRMTQGGP